MLYAGEDLATSACEVFGEVSEALLCPNYRVALLRPTAPVAVQDLVSAGGALSIGALPSLSDGALPRALTQEWARAVLEDEPSEPVRGIRYRSAYNGGESLALWNCEDVVETVVAAGVEQDFALSDPPMLARMLVVMPGRRITVRVISSADCSIC